MRLRPQEIERLARRIIKTLDEKKLFVAKVELGKLHQRIIDLIQKNVEEEAAIDLETTKVIGQYEEQIRRGEVDYHRMYQMIKAKIAKDRKFVL